MEKKILVEGMMCNHCKMAVEKVLSAVPGVTAANVDLEAKTACVVCGEEVCGHREEGLHACEGAVSANVRQETVGRFLLHFCSQNASSHIICQ